MLRQGDAQLPFAVLPADAGAALRAQHRRDATLALAAQRVAAPAREIASRRGPAWPWLGAWLALASQNRLAPTDRKFRVSVTGTPPAVATSWKHE